MIDKLPSTKGAFVGITGSMGSTDIVFKILVLKINEIIDHLNALEAQSGKQYTGAADGLTDSESNPDEAHVLTVHGTVRQAKVDMEKLISVYNLEGKVNFYAKNIRGHGRRVTCVIKANAWSPYAIGRATCSLSDGFYLYVGQIIALRRALRLDVPRYYTHMPQQKGEE